MNITEAEAKEYLSFVCYQEVGLEWNRERQARYPGCPTIQPCRGSAQVEQTAAELAPIFRDVMNKLIDSLDAGLNMCLLDIDKRYAIVISNIFFNTMHIALPSLGSCKLQWTPSEKDGIRGRIDIRRILETSKQELAEKVKQHAESESAEAREMSEYTRRLAEYRQQRAKALVDAQEAVKHVAKAETDTLPHKRKPEEIQESPPSKKPVVEQQKPISQVHQEKAPDIDAILKPLKEKIQNARSEMSKTGNVPVFQGEAYRAVKTHIVHLKDPIRRQLYIEFMEKGYEEFIRAHGL